MNINSVNKVEEMVETYLNGNISDFKRWLKSTNKKNVVFAIQLLGNYWNRENSTRKGSYEAAIIIVYQYLE